MPVTQQEKDEAMAKLKETLARVKPRSPEFIAEMKKTADALAQEMCDNIKAQKPK